MLVVDVGCSFSFEQSVAQVHCSMETNGRSKFDLFLVILRDLNPLMLRYRKTMETKCIILQIHHLNTYTEYERNCPLYSWVIMVSYL